jgi:hypothetical protein
MITLYLVAQSKVIVVGSPFNSSKVGELNPQCVVFPLRHLVDVLEAQPLLSTYNKVVCAYLKIHGYSMQCNFSPACPNPFSYASQSLRK